MSSFIRQFHISFSKNNYNKGVIPFYKVITPVLSIHSAVREMYTHTINKRLKLKSVDEIQNASSRKKPLAVILPWLNAKETHIEKFCNLYISRDFDVLTINMTPKDFLFPVFGSQVTAKNVLDYFTSHDNYKDIFVHSLSAGGYFMGEMFVQMRKDPEKYKDITSRIRGVILDSFADFEDSTKGFSLSITENPVGIKILEWYFSTHLALMFHVTTKHYLTALKNFHYTPLKCPALFFVSKADKVADIATNKMVMENWDVRGVDVKMKCWKDSKHVMHLHKYREEYVAEVDKFLLKVNLFRSK